MRLSEILSKPIISEFKQVDNFLATSLKCGKQKKISVGKVGLNFYCVNCGDVRTFCSGDELFCIGVHDKSVSIDCTLTCPQCGATIPLWFLVESQNSITAYTPEVRILKRSAKFSEQVQPNPYTYGDFSELLDKAERAYREELGAGSVIYLRKVYEQIAVQAADAASINRLDPAGNRKKFKTLLKEVDRRWSIIPRQFSENGYTLFEELSDVIHGDYDEGIALQKYVSLRKLVLGVLDNVRKNQELAQEVGNLGWNDEEVSQ